MSKSNRSKRLIKAVGKIWMQVRENKWIELNQNSKDKITSLD